MILVTIGSMIAIVAAAEAAKRLANAAFPNDEADDAIHAYWQGRATGETLQREAARRRAAPAHPLEQQLRAEPAWRELRQPGIPATRRAALQRQLLKRYHPDRHAQATAAARAAAHRCTRSILDTAG